MHSFINSTAIQYFSQNCHKSFLLRFIFVLIFLPGLLAIFNLPAIGQGPTTGSFVGQITDSKSGVGIPGATVTFTNEDNGFEVSTRTDSNGNFQRTGLQPGTYTIRVTANNYVTPTSETRKLFATKSNDFIPIPFKLDPVSVSVEMNQGQVSGNVTPTPSPTPEAGNDKDNGNTTSGDNGSSRLEEEAISLSPRRGGTFSENEVSGLPLGSTTLTRTFDELALLIPGVAPPPQAIGNTVGPGVGGGVGTSGQFAVNGLRSRANNFTVDGSDNNDEDIGVRRQGFFSLVPQPIESVQEFSIITLLAPPEFGRNLGAQINVNSKSGGSNFRGTLYGLGNADFLNARNFFDNASGDSTSVLQARTNTGTVLPVLVDGAQKTLINDAGEKDTFSILQGGFAVGGPIVRDRNMFFFASGEGQWLNGTQERHFVVPTVEQRSLFGFPQGLQACFGLIVGGQCRTNNNGTPGNPINFSPGFPTSVGGDAVFSLFPFPNDPNGIYGRNTYTQALSTDARGRIFSGRFDWNIFNINTNPQTFTARYNYTDDRRDLTDVGGALFSAIRPLVRTDNFSSFLNGSLTSNLTNEFRFSWGRTQLEFEELPDASGFLRPVSSSIITNAADRRFLLNAPVVFNNTLPSNCSPTGCVGATTVIYDTQSFSTQNSDLGPIGQLNIAGYSPVGVDVFNFPQERKNDTFQFADTLRWQVGRHAISTGADIRRVYLDSDLPRNSRPLVTFTGVPCNQLIGSLFGCTRPSSALDLAASGAPSGFFQSLILPGEDSRIKLSYTQYNFFAQDEWRINPRLNITYGLRYEYNTTPVEADNKIERTFQLQREQFPTPAAIFNTDLFQGFSDFIEGRTKIYDPDRNNFAPRVSFAWSPTSDTVIRGGYGIYYDQIIGSVVSQSRNVFPTFTTANTGGGDLFCNDFFQPLNPITGNFNPSNCDADSRIVQPGTLNTLNTAVFTVRNLLTGLSFFPIRFIPNPNDPANPIPTSTGVSFGATLPSRKLDTPMSQQYSIGVEQRLFSGTFLSAAYVGTTGRNLLRFTTPNLGNNYLVFVSSILLNEGQPQVTGITVDPFSIGNLNALTPNSTRLRGRPNPNVGPINRFETTGRSRYDSLQIALRGRLAQRFQYQTSYVFGEVKDDVSDVFDLAGAHALPQNSITFAGEYAPANFDVRHRFTYSFIYDTPGLRSQNDVIRFLIGGWQFAGTGKYSSGQPFTVNSLVDVNLDGNLTDRLDNTQFISETGDRRQPLQLTITSRADLNSMLAPISQDGDIPRNSFRAGSILELDLSFTKRFVFKEDQNVQFRVDVFNFINRANFGIPVRFLESTGFGQVTDTITPGRRIQLGLKYNF